MFIIIIYGDGLAQGFVVELGDGLVVHNTMTGYVNKLTTLIALSYLIQRFSQSHNGSKHFIKAGNVSFAQQLVGLEVLLESLCHI